MSVAWSKLARLPAPVRLLAFLLVLLLLWLPIAVPIALSLPDANAVTIATMTVLFVEFLAWIQLWGRKVHRDARILSTYGLVRSQQNTLELLLGIAFGLISLFLMFGVQGGMGWIEWQPVKLALLQVTLEGVLTGFGTGLAEELVFRGWLLDELERDYNPGISLWGNSLIFACLHFIKPIPEIIRTFPQFPGLVLLGLALVWAKRSTRHPSCPNGRLGLPIGLHSGLVWGYYVIHVGNLISYRDRVPDWLTGIDQNPLAGAVGLIVLTALAGLMRWRSQVNQRFNKS